MVQPDDYYFMAQAIRLAERGLFTTDPNPRVGCVLVNKGEVVGQGWHERAGEPHAEVIALRNAGVAAKGATAYVSLEPCSHQGRTPPCSHALIEAGVRRVVVAMEDPNPQVAGQGILQCREAGIDVDVGVMATQAAGLNPGFIKRMRQGRPFVRCKMAMSMDGRTAMASGKSQWITGEHARQDAHRLRARSSAIITGIGTVLADDPSMNARLDDGSRYDKDVIQPVRVVLDSQIKMPVNARMLSLPGRTIVCTSAATDTNQQTKKKSEQLKNAGAEIVQIQDDKGRIALNALLEYLGSEQINEVLLEAGAILSGAFMRSGLVDEVIVYMAPILMGDSARGLFSLPGITAMSDTQKMRILEVRAVGDDWRITAKPEMV